MKFDFFIVVIVIGGVFGLGEGMVCCLVVEGVKVVIFDMNVECGEQVVSEIGGVFCYVNVVDEDSVNVGFEKVCVVYGQECVLVNCVGIGGVEKMVCCFGLIGEILVYDMGCFMCIILINLIGLFMCVVKVVEGMMGLDLLGDSGCGVIVYIVLVVVQDGQIGQVVYFVFKGGIYGMILLMVCDFVKEGICVNMILLGFFEMLIYQQMLLEVKVNLVFYL